MMDAEEFHYFGEYSLDGVAYIADCPKEGLVHIRDELQLLEDDIIVATYPKAGTTWMQEIIYCLQHGPGASERRDKSLDEVFPYLEILFPGMFNGLEEIKALPRPRLIKTHLHPSYFKRQLEDETTCPRFVVVLRNPKDVLTSYYHFHKTWPAEFSFPKDWDYFFGMFKEKRLLYGDYFDHILSWWKYRNHPRVLVVKYEDMKKIHWEISRKSGSFWGVQTTPTAIWKRS